MNKHVLTHKNYYAPIRPSVGDPPPDAHRFDGVVSAAKAWSKKHPNPYQPKAKTNKICPAK